MISLTQARSKFHTAAKHAENSKLDAELARKSYIPQIEKDKFILKANNYLKEAKEAEMGYIKTITYANQVRLYYIDAGKTTLQNFQFLEEEFIDFNKNLMRKFFIYSTSCAKMIIHDNDKMREVGIKCVTNLEN
jgi:hypothetical protein